VTEIRVHVRPEGTHNNGDSCVCVCVYNIFNLYCHWCIANSCSRVRLFYGQKATGYARDPILLYYTVIITITIIIIIIIFGSESRNAFFRSRRSIICYAYDTVYVLQCVCILLLLLLYYSACTTIKLHVVRIRVRS